MAHPDYMPAGTPVRPTPCGECPWRRESLPGWLGPMAADEWLAAAHGEVAIACHQSIPSGGGWGPSTLQCAGAATFRANVCKRPRDPDMAVGPEDRDAVFGWNDQFEAHHAGAS